MWWRCVWDLGGSARRCRAGGRAGLSTTGVTNLVDKSMDKWARAAPVQGVQEIARWTGRMLPGASHRARHPGAGSPVDIVGVALCAGLAESGDGVVHGARRLACGVAVSSWRGRRSMDSRVDAEGQSVVASVVLSWHHLEGHFWIGRIKCTRTGCIVYAPMCSCRACVPDAPARQAHGGPVPTLWWRVPAVLLRRLVCPRRAVPRWRGGGRDGVLPCRVPTCRWTGGKRPADGPFRPP